MLGWAYRAQSTEAACYCALLNNTTTPDADDDSMTDVTEVTAGNGYTSGGVSLTPGATDFDTWTEVDASDWAIVQLKDVVWTASGGQLPNGDTAYWAVLTDDNATVADREIYHYWSLGSGRTVSDGQTLTLQDCEIRIAES